MMKMSEAQQRFHDQLEEVSPTLAIWLRNRLRQGITLEHAQDQLRAAIDVVEQGKRAAT